MLKLPDFAKQLTGSQRDEALVTMRRMMPAIEWMGEGPARTGLDAARVVYQGAGVFEYHATAIIDAASAVGERTAIVHSPFTLVEEFAVHPTLDTIRVDLSMLRDFIIAMDLDSDESRYVEELDSISAVAELLAPMFPSEWIWFSEHGNWIFGSWNWGDESTIAGVRSFLDAYERSRPVSSLEVVEWILVEGRLAASRVTISEATSRIGRLFRRKLRYEDRFEESSLERHLDSMYPSGVGQELWDINERVHESETERFVQRLDPHQRMELYLETNPSVAVRLREIWNAY